jgi:hypothetical protein
MQTGLNAGIEFCWDEDRVAKKFVCVYRQSVAVNVDRLGSSYSQR